MNEIALIPVMEVEPSHFQRVNRESPNVTARANPEAWDEYWFGSLADSGIRDLKPYEPGSWLVPLAGIEPNESMVQLMRAEIEAMEYHLSNLRKDDIGSIGGGYALEVDGTAAVYPQCCGALDNISEWERFSLSDNTEEEMLWIGHPWLMVKSISSTLLEIRKTAEYGEPEEPVVIRLSKAGLQAAVETARDELSEFCLTLRKVLPRAFSVPLSQEVLDMMTTIMVYGHATV